MGNQPSSSSKRRSSRKPQTAAEHAAERAKRVVGDLQEGIKNSVKKLDDDHPAAQILDHVCGTYYHDEDKYRSSRVASYYSEEASEDGSRTFQSEDDTTYDGRRGRRSDRSVDSRSYVTQSDYDSDSRRRGRGGSFDTEDESRVTHENEPKLISKPLASSFAKRCYFTKSGIGKTTQHYEGLTLTGNVVLMLASAMKLKGCPTICDEDLRRVEQTYPNQFSRLPDELLLSSGWRRISKYCHFSNKSIPDGIPFFHSKQRLHPSGGYYFLLAASVGMIRPIDVEPLTKDTLVLLETDYPNQCDATPSILIRDPDQWVVVNKFCFFSGGPINTEEDVYYQADFDGNPIYMLAFLSPSLTPEELYKLTDVGTEHEPGLKSIADVQEVESVYDLTERDFDDLKLYHLGPCRALPQYILQPSAWTKVLPPHFLAARQQAMLRAQDYNADHYREQVADQHNDVYDQGLLPIGESNQIHAPSAVPGIAEHPFVEAREASAFEEETMNLTAGQTTFVREAEEEGAFHSMHSGENHAFVINQGESSVPVDLSDQLGDRPFEEEEPTIAGFSRMDPPDDEPPSLKIGSMEENQHASPRYGTDRHKNDASSPSIKPDIDEHGFFTLDPRLNHDQNNIVEEEDSCNQYVSPVSESLNNQDRQFDSAENEETPQGFRFSGGNLYFEDEGMLPSNRHTQEPFQSTNYIDEYQDAAGVGMNHVEGPPRVEDGFEESHEIDDTTEVYQQDMERTSINNNELPYDSRFIDSDLPQVLSNANEEKPIQIGKDPVGSDLINSGDVCEEDPEISCASDKPGDEFVDPIDTSFSRQDELDNSALASTSSPAGMSTNSGVDTRNHQSPAMRGAHAILKRNRRRRAESNRSSTGKVSNNNTMISPAMSEKLTSTKSDTSKDMWDENGTDITGSGVSVSSGVTDKSSRRQLILQMAKARMKNNRDSPSKSPSGINEDDDGANTIVTEGNATFATHDFDLTGDLD